MSALREVGSGGLQVGLRPPGVESEAAPSGAASGRRESLARVWARRAISVPIYGALAAACVVGSPVWLGLSVVADTVGGPRGRWPRTRAFGFATLYLVAEVVGVVAAALVANPNRLLLRYVLKRELLWDPCLDIVGRRLPNAFIDRQAARNRGEIDAISRLGRGLGPDSAALIYPEGTRFAPQKLARAKEKLSATPYAPLSRVASQYRNVLPPRLGGALALLDAAPDTDVLLLEHTGFEGAATLAGFLGGGLVGKTLHVRLRRFSMAEIPVARRADWLYERWAELDAWIDGQRRRERAPDA
ncbi:MAG: 1-acyl-sn-glycerol-3-phosphate acyltransferase [Myxococcota bacterium]